MLRLLPAVHFAPLGGSDLLLFPDSVILRTTTTMSGLFLILVLTSWTISSCEDIYKEVKVEEEVKAKPGDNVTLKCGSVSGEISVLLWSRDDLDDPKYIFYYQDNKKNPNNMHLRFKDRVTRKGSTADIILERVTVSDTGIYKCLVHGKNVSEEGVVKLTVTDGAAPKPSVTSLKATESWSLLQCEVLGASPKPCVEWQDSSGNILPAKEPEVSERGSSYDISLQVTVTKSDHYYCVVTQEAINHQTRAEIDVYIYGPPKGPIVVGVLGVVAVVAGVLVFLVVRRRRQREIFKVVKAKRGEDVTLKGVSDPGDFNLLQWTRDDLGQDKCYPDNKVDEGDIDQRFKDRVTWKDSKTDIILKNVTVNDTGIYKCLGHLENNLHQKGVVNLMVTDGEFPDVRLHVSK